MFVCCKHKISLNFFFLSFNFFVVIKLKVRHKLEKLNYKHFCKLLYKKAKIIAHIHIYIYIYIYIMYLNLTLFIYNVFKFNET